MNFQHFIWFLSILRAVVSLSFQNIQSNFIDGSVSLGQFVDIGPDVVIDRYSSVDSFAKILSNTHIGQNSRIGTYSSVGGGCNIGHNVNIQAYVKVANGVEIGSYSVFNGFNVVGNGGKIGNYVKLNQYSGIGTRAEIRDECILDQFSSVGDNARLMPRVYLGQYSTIQPNAMVGESAVIHKFVEIESGAHIRPNQVIIRTPSSFELYQYCAPVLPTEKANMADRRTNGLISPEFNSMLSQMIDTEINTISAKCSQGIGQMGPTMLQEIISMYLIQYHGLQRFNEIVQQMSQCHGAQSMSIINGQVFFDGTSIPETLMWKLQHEYHFGEYSQKVILEPNVTRKFIQLLAIYQDAQRYERVSNDNYCKMVEQIQSGERDVACAKPKFNNGQTIISN